MPLTEAQIEFLAEANKKERELKTDLTSDPRGVILSNYWTLYFELLIFQARVLKSTKKRGTHFVKKAKRRAPFGTTTWT